MHREEMMLLRQQQRHLHRQSDQRRRWSSSTMSLLVIVLFCFISSIHAITVPVDDIPVPQIQNRKFTVDNRGYAHVPQDLNLDNGEFLPVPFRNVSGQDPRNRRIVPVMTFYIPTNGGQYYHAKLRPQDQSQQLLHDPQQQAPPPPSHHYSVKGHQQQQQPSVPQRFNANQYSQQLSKPGHYPIVHPSVGSGGVLLASHKQPTPSSLSLAIANNYRTQYHQASAPQPPPQFESQNRRPPFSPLPPKYIPTQQQQPTKMSYQPQSPALAPGQIFYGGGGSSARPNSLSPSQLNNQPYVIVSGGGGAGSSAEKLHHGHRPSPQSHPSQAPHGPLANENQHHNLLTSPENVGRYVESGKGITPFLPSNSVPGGFRPMLSSQKVNHVPLEVLQRYEQEGGGDIPADNYQFVSTTEKPLKYKYHSYQPQQSVSTERPYYDDYSIVQKQKFVTQPPPQSIEAENELEEERKSYYSNVKALNYQQAVQRLPNFDEGQFVTPAPFPSPPPPLRNANHRYPNQHQQPTEQPYIISSTTPSRPRPHKPKFSSTYRAGYLAVPDSAVTSTTPAPYKSVVPSFRKLKPTPFYSPSSTPVSKFYATTAAPLGLHPTGQHLTETTFVNPTRISTYHPKINKSPTRHPGPAPEYPSQYYYLDQQQAVATPRPTPQPSRYNEYGDEQITFDDNQSLSQLLKKLQDSNHLPKTLTPNNIDNSIKTLIKILNNLKQSPNLAPDQHLQRPSSPQSSAASVPDYNDSQDYYYDKVSASDPLINDADSGNHVDEQLGANSGTPGVDYPNLFEIPTTQFNCKEQRYKGFFGDPETRCQVWHYCDLNGGQASFLCPNGTIFSQVALTCDWWFNVKCDTTAQLYVLNERLYKYILPFTPKFPEDYSGPLVDKYLALKFKEMEEKMRKQKGGRVNGEDGVGASSGLGDIESTEDNDDELGGISSIDQGIGISKMDGGALASVEVMERLEARPTTTSNPVQTTTDAVDELDDDDGEGLVDEVTGSNELEVRVPPPTKPMDSHPPPPHVLRESQTAPLVEINSDGSSGHLTPLRLRGG